MVLGGPYFGVPPDVDGNGRVVVVLMDIVDGLSGSTFLAGVFLHLNQLAFSGGCAVTGFSNHMDMVFVDTKAAQQGTALGTLAHEFQHLIHYQSDEDETVWIDEAAATYAT